MPRYANFSGNSGIDSYEVGSDFIAVVFRDGWAYLYTHDITGAAAVEEMKALAAHGEGLCEFISQHVGKRYAKKWNVMR